MKMCIVHGYDVIIFCDCMYFCCVSIVEVYESLSVWLNMIDILLLNGDYI
jgi:hypothetical protein